jgi:hypothetical protein
LALTISAANYKDKEASSFAKLSFSKEHVCFFSQFRPDTVRTTPNTFFVASDRIVHFDALLHAFGMLNREPFQAPT